MADSTNRRIPPTAAVAQATIGPGHHGTLIGLEAFLVAEFEGGYRYELARGVIEATEIAEVQHGLVIMELTDGLALYVRDHPGVINYHPCAAGCRLIAPGIGSVRHPDHAIYLLPPPKGPRVWSRWLPQIVVEVIAEGSTRRDYVEKRGEYLRMGVLEYWILDPRAGTMLVHQREGDTRAEVHVAIDGVYKTHLLPGLEVLPADLLVPPE